MRVYVPTVTTRNVLAARRWTASLQSGFVDELERWIASVESSLGKCTVFLEIALPVPSGIRNKHGQVDLIVAFADRAAVCEVKGHCAHQLSMRQRHEAVDQVVAQTDLVKELAVHCGYQRNNVRAFLFFPRFDRAELVAAEREVHDWNNDVHVRVTGADPALRGTRAGSGALLFLPEALSDGLASARPAGGAAHLGERIKSKIESGNNRLSEFTSFQHLQQYVRALPMRGVFLPSVSHVPGLRTSELQQGLSILEHARVLEVCGPPGIGKTSLARDVIEQFIADRQSSGQGSYEHHELTLRRCRRLQDAAFDLAAALFGHTQNALDLRGLVDALVHERLVISILDHDQVSLQGLGKLLEMIPPAAPGTPTSRFVIESHRPLGGFPRIDLTGLDPIGLTKILRRVSPGGAFSDPEIVIARANGNPRLARTLWESTALPPVSCSVQPGFSWFRHQLTDAEQQALDAIAVVMDVAPLGIPVSSLVAWCRKVMTGELPTKVETVCRGLIARLERAQLARVVAVEQSMVTAAIVDLPDDMPYPTIVVDIDLGLLAECLSGTTTDRVQQRRDAFGDYLIDCESQDDDLLGVTLALRLGDLGPFFRSSFRHTSTPAVVAWLDRIGFADGLASSDPQLVLARALKVIASLRDHGALSVADIDAALGPHSSASPMGHHVKQVLRGHAVALSRDGALDLDAWRTECSTESDRDVRAEMEIRLAVAHAARGEHQRAWEQLQELVARPELRPSIRTLARVHALAQLNRQKVALAGVDSDLRRATIQRLAAELVALGLQTGNLATLANALFYSIRDTEFWLARVPLNDDVYRKLQGYLAGLEFVEHNSRARRLQAILTQGSIHRHCGRWDELTFDVFQVHLSAAVALYRRVLDSALPRRQLTLAINAVNYMVDLVKKVLRYAEPEARPDIVDVVRTTLDMIEQLRLGVTGASVNPTDHRMLKMIERDAVVLEYLMGCERGAVDASRVPQFAQQFGRWVQDLLDALPSSGMTLRPLLEDMRFLARICELVGCWAKPTAFDSEVRRHTRRLVSETEELDRRLRDKRLSRLRRRLDAVPQPEPAGDDANASPLMSRRRSD